METNQEHLKAVSPSPALRLKIHLEGKLLLCAESRSEGGVLSFKDDQYPDVWHNAGRLIQALFGPDHMEAIGLMEPQDHLKMRVSLIAEETLVVRYNDAGSIILTDAYSWWLPLEQATLGDILEDTGMGKYAEPINVDNPFGAHS
ncbi:hypothetical protein LCGC14_0227880 [marine sediment metagenome]|jgi:hypothetical protein|uniref:Uncharacterized protein n=1 Tax=marine sediment metagenome TaxID=412755 RepID=A0A0F9UFI4_9ZZZZ